MTFLEFHEFESNRREINKNMVTQTSDTLARFDGEGNIIPQTPVPIEYQVENQNAGYQTIARTPPDKELSNLPTSGFAHVGPPLADYLIPITPITSLGGTGAIVPPGQSSSPNQAIVGYDWAKHQQQDPDPGKVVFKSGAARSKLMSWFTFVPRYFIQRIADVFTYGAKKYGLRNWQKGDQDFIDEIPDHIINHIYEYIEEVNAGGSGKDKEDHLANIGCNLVMLMHFQTQSKYPQRTQG